MIDEDRLVKDEHEKQYYGISSTDLYLEVRISLEYILKKQILQFSQVFEELKKPAPREMLLEEYNKCMSHIEEPLKKFYEEAQKVFEIPENAISPDYAKDFSDSSVQTLKDLENDCLNLQRDIARKKLFLSKLIIYKILIETVVIPKYNEAKQLQEKILKQDDDNNRTKKLLAEMDDVLKTINNFLIKPRQTFNN